MRIRRRNRSPLVLWLLPTLAASLSTESRAKPGSVEQLARDTIPNIGNSLASGNGVSGNGVNVNKIGSSVGGSNVGGGGVVVGGSGSMNSISGTISGTVSGSNVGNSANLAGPGAYATLPEAAILGSNQAKPERGTKDAPVDGLDGKPHKGPFVESTRKKPVPAVEELSSSESISGGGGSSSVSPGKDKDSKEKMLMETWEIPEEDGVMSDVGDRAAIKGPTGIEGGVSQKERERKEKGQGEQKLPEQPKEAPPRPESIQYTLQGGKIEKEKEQEIVEKKKGAAGLAKPLDLPLKPHDIPYPKAHTVPKSDALGSSATTGKSSTSTPIDASDPDSILHPFHSFILSFTMIIFSEIGDKTFLVAALMAMRHPRFIVFSAAFSALIAMTILSALLGHTVPTLLPKRFTNFAAAILFLAFGAKMIKEGLAMAADEGVGAEMKEVEMELEEKEQEMRRFKRRSSNAVSPYLLESGRGRRSRSSSKLPVLPRSPSSSPSPPPSPGQMSPISSLLSGLNNLLSLLLSPAWVQTFVMTFLGEWGDRSQIATIAMAAGQDYWWVTGGAVIGHGFCTAGAVIGGRALAGRVSLRVVTLGGAIAFVVFGLIYLAESVYSS